MYTKNKLSYLSFLLSATFVLFFSFFSNAHAQAFITTTLNGFSNTNGVALCTSGNTAGCQPFESAGRQSGYVFQGTFVGQGSMLLGTKISGQSYVFNTGTTINGSSSNVVTFTGTIASSPPGMTPVRAAYECSGTGLGTNVPISAQIAPNGTWTVPIPTGGQDASCSLTIQYAIDPDYVPTTPSSGSGSGCTGVCGTTLTLTNPGSRTAQRGQTVAYTLTVGQAGLIWPTNIDVTCPADSECRLLNFLGEQLSNCQFDPLAPGGGNCSIYNPDYTGRFPASYFVSGGSSYQLLVTPLNASAYGNQNIVVRAKTASQRRIDPSDTSSAIVDDCVGVCTVSTTAQLTVEPPLVPPVVTLSGSPASGTSPLNTTLTWSATNNPLSCTASGSWTGNKSITGNQLISGLTSSQSYILTCTNTAGTGSATANISVSSPPGVCTPGATRSFGNSSCTGTETCTANGTWPGTANYGSGTYASNGQSCNTNSCMTGQSCSSGVCTGGTAVTTGQCSTGGGGGTCTPGLTTVTADGYSANGGSSIPYHNQVTVSWNAVPGATGYRVKIWDTADRDSDGRRNTQTFAPQAVYIIDITTSATSVTVPYGSASTLTKQFLGTVDTVGCSGGIQINYRVVPDNTTGNTPTPTPTNTSGPAPVVTLTVAQNPIPYATRPTLQWDIKNATSCFDEHGNMPSGGNWKTAQNGSGLAPVAIYSSEKYKLTCYGPGGSDAKEVTVSVDPSTVSGGTGKCGNAHEKIYPYGSDTYGTDLQCAPGNVSNDTGFPSPGQAFWWRCNTGPTFVFSGSDECFAFQASASSVCTLPSNRPTPTITAPASAPVNSQFEITCDYGSSKDYIPAPAGCVWPGSGGGHIGSAATFTCTAGGVPTTKSYSCQSQNSSDPQFTKWCSLPSPTATKQVTITGNKPTVQLNIIPDPTGGNPPVITWNTGNNPDSCVASSNPSYTGWSGSKSASGGSSSLSGLTQQTDLTLTCTNPGGATSKTVTVIPTNTPQFSITVLKNQGGSVRSSDGGISCGGTCVKSYNQGTVVTLIPTPEPRYKFVGWSGACSGMGSGPTSACVITVNSAKTVTANFALKSLLYEEF